MSFNTTRRRPLLQPPAKVYAAPIIALSQQSVAYTGGVAFNSGPTTVDAAVGDEVLLFWHGNGTFNVAPVDSAGNTYTVGPVINSGGRMTNAYAKITNPLPAGSTFQINAATTGSGNIQVVIIRKSLGLDSSAATFAGASTTTTEALAFTPGAQPVWALMSVWTDGGGDTLSTPAGWTLLDRDSPASPPTNTKFNSSFIFYKFIKDPAAVNVSDTSFSATSAQGTCAMNAITIKV